MKKPNRKRVLLALMVAWAFGLVVSKDLLSENIWWAGLLLLGAMITGFLFHFELRNSLFHTK